MSIEHFRNWKNSVQVEVILYVCITLLSHTTVLFFFKISAIFQSCSIINIAGLLESTNQTKTFSSSNANKK